MNCSVCLCGNSTVATSNEDSMDENKLPPFNIVTSTFDVSAKELFILTLFFILLLYSVLTFLAQWNKNYREINHLPYYEIYIEETPQLSGGKIY